jgi:hypothetical protein
MRSIFLAALGAVLFLAPTWGQVQSSGEDATIDTILSQKAITFGNAAWLVGRAGGWYDDRVTPDKASALAKEAGWGNHSNGDALDLQSFGLILVKALSIPTGVVYSVFPGPRYALRELVFRKIVPATLAPDDAVSGEEAMRYLQAAQDWKEAKQ